MSDGSKVVDLQGFPVPGMKAAYQFQVADGRMLAYEMAMEDTIHLDDLNERLDTLRRAAERQTAFVSLDIVQQRLRQNEAAVPAKRMEIAGMTQAAMAKAGEARQRAARASSRERREQEFEVSQSDQGDIFKEEAKLAHLLAIIEHDRTWEIPRLKAIIAGVESHEFVPGKPEPEPELMAIAAAE